MKRYSTNSEGKTPDAVVLRGDVWCTVQCDENGQDQPVLEFHFELRTHNGQHNVVVELVLERGERHAFLSGEDIRAVTQMAIDTVNDRGTLVPITFRNALYNHIQTSGETKQAYRRAATALEEQREADALAEVLF